MRTPSLQSSSRPVAIWVSTGVFMLLVQVILGGITRLTGSGLSITEWDIFTGALPPLSHQQWVTEFDKYRHTPQFHLLNTGFSLPDFKFIFFWEWFHRFWARMVGVVFLAGFGYLLLQRRIRREMIAPLLILFLLGAMQGAIGWIMVKSGLTGDAIYVRPTKLALHFIFALGLISYAWWFAMQLVIPARERIRNSKVRNFAIAILLLLFFQLLFGALMAGHKAANVAATWPAINGEWLPASLFKESPWLLNFIDNRITIHFIHRGLAYALLILVLYWSIKTIRVSIVSTYFRKLRWVPLAMVFLQVSLGIITVLTSTRIIPGQWGMFEWVAELHQITGMLFLLTMISVLYLVRPGESR